MTSITNTTVLSLFDLLKAAVVADSTLSFKFSANNILQFEPNHKAVNFTGFPYIWFNIPNTDSSKVVFDNNFTVKDLSVSAFMRIDWLARSNVLSYANAMIRAIESYESTFQASGYHDVMIDVIDVNPHQIIDQKDIVEVEFLITFRGQVSR